MSAQYTYCPTCGTRRVGHGYRCSVCDRQLPRKVQTPASPQQEPKRWRTIVSRSA